MPSKVPRKSFPSKVTKGSQEEVTKHSQARSPSQVLNQGSQISQEQVPKFPKSYQEQVAKSRFPSKVTKPSSKQGPQAMFPGTFPKVLKGSRKQISKQGSQEKVPKDSQRFPSKVTQEQVPVSKQSFCCSQQMVNKRFISVYLTQLSNIIIQTNCC